MSAAGGAAAGGALPFGSAASARRAGASSQRAAGFVRRHASMSAVTAARACSGVGVSPSRTPGISVVVFPSHRATTTPPLGDGGASWRGRPLPRDCASTMPPRASGSTASTKSVRFDIIASPPLGVCRGNHGERGERAGERERQAQRRPTRCGARDARRELDAAGGRSERPSASAAAAALPRIVRRSHHDYPDSLLVPERLLLRCRDIPDLRELDVYLQHGGYEATRKALTAHKPEVLVEMVKASNLRGRGGAGFPTGMKWSFLPKQSEKPVYLAVNADESEPGTFKDREIIEDDPHQLLEGIIISAYAIRCHTAYVYIRGEFARGARVLEEAITQARAKGLLGRNILGTGFDLDVWVHRGAGAYICGEETGLIESLEGKRAYPRIKPPFPAIYGLFGCPTIVNNVETLACVPHIVLRGADWFRSIGPEKSPGPKLFCVSGHVVRPGTYELPMGTPLREIIYTHAGGIPGDRKLKAVIPGGASMPVFTADEIDVPMDMDSVQKAGSFLGSAGIMVMDETVCMVWALLIIERFFHHESCGQCTPCREGTGWLEKVLRRLEEGDGTAAAADVDLLLNIAGNMMGTTICALSDAAAMPARAFVTKYRAEFEQHAVLGRCPLRPVAELPRRHAHA